ncbi:MAG: hypothetical protein KF795_24100 [Labilithrix sp.]|nr:hypothetical protein [Labilithrix sp.]
MSLASLPRGSSVLVALALVAACQASPAADPGSVVAFSLEAELAAGQEAHFCRYVRMPDGPPDQRLFVRGGRHDLADGTHHYLLYRTRVTAWADGMDRVVPCDEHEAVMKSATSYVTGGQTPHEDADFPAAAALAFRPGEILLLQGHFVNASPRARTVRVDLALRTAASSAVEHEAGVLRYYNPFIFVPPRGKATAKMACTLKKDITLLSAAAHMHARGVAYRAYVDLPGAPPSEAPFYTTKDGLHPTFYAGFMALPAGSTIRYECDYENAAGERPVVQGLSAEADEMCMLSAFYYPAMAPEDEACEDMSGHGTGTATCLDTVACLEGCPVSERPDFSSGDPRVGACWQRCITSSCPAVTGALFPELACTAAKCAAECAAMGEPCRACVIERCAAELDACARTACAP